MISYLTIKWKSWFEISRSASLKVKLERISIYDHCYVGRLCYSSDILCHIGSNL